MNDTAGTITKRPANREVASAEAQIATADEQIAEMQGSINDAEMQIDAMMDEIRKRRSFIKAETRRMNKLAARRAVFIEAASSLRKLDLP